MQTVSLGLFTVFGKVLVSEHSTLQLRELGRIYPDACDAGFEILNPKTGETTTWAYGQSVYRDDLDRELMYENFYPTPESLKKFPKLRGWMVEVFND